MTATLVLPITAWWYNKISSGKRKFFRGWGNGGLFHVWERKKVFGDFLFIDASVLRVGTMKIVYFGLGVRTLGINCLWKFIKCTDYELMLFYLFYIH